MRIKNRKAVALPYYYISAINGADRATVAGPFDAYTRARETIPEARRTLSLTDSHASFYTWGVFGSEDSHLPSILGAPIKKGLRKWKTTTLAPPSGES